MEELLVQIEIALQYNLYYLALQSTLTLPDICSALMDPKGETSGAKYIAWYDKYVKNNEYYQLSGNDCYRFRCSNLHQGSSIHPKSTYGRIMFVEPETTPLTIHNCVINDALCIDVNLFCKHIISSVRKWLSIVKNDAIFNNNYQNIIKRYPQGLSPYISGVPIIS